MIFYRCCSMNKTRYRISSELLLFTACMILIVPLQWICAAVVAALFHEACHRFMLSMLGMKKSNIRIDISGAKMQMPPYNARKELLCALAGPVGGLMLLFLGRWLPRTAFCAGVQSCINLLPIYPLDGGRALRCALSMGCEPGTSRTIGDVMGTVSKAILLGLSIYASMALRLGLFPMLLCLLLLIRIK